MEIPVWILGSSLFGAQLAAHLGLPYAFASHFAPGYLEKASQVYRDMFRPSRYLERPHFMMAVNVFAGDTLEEAIYYRSSAEQMVINLRFGQPGPLQPPVENLRSQVDPGQMEMVDEFLKISITGTQEQLKDQISILRERYRPDEIMFNSNSYSREIRLKGFQYVAEILK